jgi:hypothetical protein
MTQWPLHATSTFPISLSAASSEFVSRRSNAGVMQPRLDPHLGCLIGSGPEIIGFVGEQIGEHRGSGAGDYGMFARVRRTLRIW